jgi:GNAT superfamily N-acetyltransferase
MIEIRPANFAEILAEKAMLAEYAAECSTEELGEINPQPDIYRELERLGMVQMFAAVRDGKMIGFVSILVTILPHYGQKTATIESLFVASAERKSGIGSIIMETAERFARESGCKAIFFSAPTDGALDRLMRMRVKDRRFKIGERPMYRMTNTIWCRRLH